MSKYLIAHDLGTSGNKASLFSTTGELIATHTEAYDVHFFGEHCAEQNPEDWWHAICKCTKEILIGINTNDVLAMSFSGQMSSCILVDKKGTLLHPAIIWADQRATKQSALLEERLGNDRVYQITGHRISPSYSLEKLMWIRDKHPKIYEQTYRMLLAKDYIIYKLTGEFVTDYSDASGTNAFDLKTRTWSKEILDAAEVDLEKFPTLHQSTDVIGTLTKKASTLLGLPSTVKVVCGGGDGPCSALGAGCIEENQLFLTYGTSAWIGGTTKDVFLDENKELFCFSHVIPNAYMPCGTMQAAGSSYAYIKKILCETESLQANIEDTSVYELMNNLVMQSECGANGLLFLPYLLGERSPRWNPNATGAFLGMRMEHQKADYIRAVLEGIAMNLELILQSYRKHIPVSTMIVTGGGAKGQVVIQILSDLLQVTLEKPNHVENATSIAAAFLAGIGIGIFKNFQEIKSFLSIEATYDTSDAHQDTYKKAKARFDYAYHCLKLFYTLEQ